MTPPRWLLPAALAAGALVWLAAGELPPAARAFTALLVGVLPPLLLAQAQVPPSALHGRALVPVYLTSMVLIWGLGIAALAIGRASGFGPATLGLVRLDPDRMLAWTAATTLAAIALAALFRAFGHSEAALLRWLLPKTLAQRIVFAGLSISAGVGEELAFRAFLVPALERASGSIALAVVVSSVAFGMMHSYQRASGALRASVLGALLAMPLLVTGSVLPSMAAHAAYDLIAGLLLADWLIPPDAGDRPGSAL